MISPADTRIVRLIWALEEENRHLGRLLRAGYSLAAADAALRRAARRQAVPLHKTSGCGYHELRRQEPPDCGNDPAVWPSSGKVES